GEFALDTVFGDDVGHFSKAPAGSVGLSVPGRCCGGAAQADRAQEDRVWNQFADFNEYSGSCLLR
ncbi:MAG TPA: hypothetical protein PLG97_12765, partial [Alcaligenes sp.]|nr:hypothetical protein [Alcaligenes sp.]